MRFVLAAVVTLFIAAVQGYVHPPTPQPKIEVRPPRGDTHVLIPRQSPQPCTQAYVCPEPRPYPNTPDSGDDPGPGNFKCRIGASSSDPNFAFCIYEKATGNRVGSTPPGIVEICWQRGMPNPACAAPARKRGIPRRRAPLSPRPIARSVNMAKFSKRRDA
jgi:hypothetical protein